MSNIFSKRNKLGLKEKTIVVRLNKQTKNRIADLVMEYDGDAIISEHHGWPETGTCSELIYTDLLKEHGILELKYISRDKYGRVNYYELFTKCRKQELLLDYIELFYPLAKSQDGFQRRINEVFEEPQLKWRLSQGQIIPVDSDYIFEEVIQPAIDKMDSLNLTNASREFNDAKSAIDEKNYRSALQFANNSLESVIKYVLKKDKAKPGTLFSGLAKSGIVPEYHKGFLDAFEQHILRSVPTIRNEEPGAGHGAGSLEIGVDKSLAVFAMNLTAVLIKFILDRFVEIQTTMSQNEIEDDLPF